MKENLYHNKKAQWGIYLFFFALLAIVPTFVDNSFMLNQFARYCVFGMLAVSVALVWGYGGILSFGQGIAFGVAAYGMAMTMQLQFQDPLEPVETTSGVISRMRHVVSGKASWGTLVRRPIWSNGTPEMYSTEVPPAS